MINKKTRIQQQAVEIFNTVDCLTLEWATGTGKSLAAILCLEEYVKTSPKKWYIVCEETQHITNWKLEFKAHSKEHLLEYVEIFCYASLHKYVNTEANLILDEAHVASNLRLDYLKTIKCDKVLILSATLPFERKQLLKNWKDFVTFEITLDDSIKLGLLSDPKVYKVEIELDSTAVKYVYSYKRGYGKKPIEFNCSYNDFHIALAKAKEENNYRINVKCTARQYYDLITFDMRQWKNLYEQENKKYQFNIFLQKGSERKRFLAEYKTPYVSKILSIIEGNRLICFCGSTKQADFLGGPLAVHSDITGNEKIIQKFNNFEINKIFAVKMLRSGINLPGIQAGIIAQLDSKSLSFIQMVGRVFRSLYPQLYVIVCKNTNDSIYFENCLKDFDEKYVKVLKM